MLKLNPVEFYKCLADETRLISVLLVHAQNELCVCELTDALNVSQPKISRHLARLRESGILVGERRGQWVYYRINPDLDSWVSETLSLALKANSLMLTEYQQRLARSMCK